MNELLQNNPDTILLPQLSTDSTGDALDPNGIKENEACISTDLMNNSGLSALPLSLGDQQFTLISTNYGGQTIQIPVVNIGNTSIALQAVQQDPNEAAKAILDPHGGNVQTALQLHDGSTLSLGDDTSSLSLPPDENTLGVEAQTQSNTLGLGTSDEGTIGIHDPSDRPTLTLTNDSLTLASHTESLDMENLKMEVLDTGHTNQGHTSPGFTMTTLENEIKVAVDDEGDTY